ncbi:ribose 5-phosphate isomerase B [Candidatus Woesearchaeota archaeon]|nr:ribose 5-phosphate isomerase B [Candidatus Woesearchaeota archaeon]
MGNDVIYIGSDHAGYRLKLKIKRLLERTGHKAVDVGVNDDRKRYDYPKTAAKVAKKVADEGGRGILLCGTGLGEAIAANKFKGVRAANCFNEYTARMSREHNDSNVLCLGARVLGGKEAEKITKAWVEADFSKEERHIRRLKQIKDIEKKACR